MKNKIAIAHVLTFPQNLLYQLGKLRSVMIHQWKALSLVLNHVISFLIAFLEQHK